MAENAANFTLTYQNKPSIFEVVAQKSLNDTIHPSLQKVALFLATNFPRKFGWLKDNFEESFLVINGLLQYYYLKCYDASFSENFYGLKRILLNNDSLTKHHKEISLICLVLLPYFQRKLEERIAVIKIEQAEGRLRSDAEGRIKRLTLLSHSLCEVTWGFLTVFYYLKYMSGEAVSQMIFLRLMDIKLIHNVEPLQNVDGFWSVFSGNCSISKLNFDFIRHAFTTSLEIGAFFLQFLQTWQQQKLDFNVTDLPLVHPPPVESKSKNYQGKCPICLKSWAMPTVLQVSGYIFCFRCILKFLSEHQKCPVTNLPAKPLDIVRLYMN